MKAAKRSPREAVAFALHDMECSDHCDPMVMNRFFVQADAVLRALEPWLRGTEADK